MRRVRTAVAVGVVLLTAAATVTAQETGQIEHSVNGHVLESEISTALMQAYGPIPSGDYWYDPMTGFWGVAGGPSIGRIMPGLELGGPLRADASGGGYGDLTGVFVNGREIHPEEYQYLVALFGQVLPGRYWLGPTMIGGIEGYPATFNLAATAASGAGGSGYNRSTLFGGLMSDGQCSGYLHPSGASVMTGNC